MLSSRRLASILALCALLSAGCQPSNANRAEPAPGTPTAANAAANPPQASSATSPAVANSAEVATTPTATQAPAPKAPAPQAPAPIAPPPTALEAAPKAEHNEWAYEDRIGPKYGILEAVDPGDNRCYLSLKAQDGQTYTLGATFVVCTDEYLNQVVQLTYERLTSLNCPDVTDDCAEMAVTAIAPVDTNQIVSTNYRNRDWNITVSSFEPWSGINDTGNATYKGCDNEGNCIELTGGTTACRDGECWTTWHNGNARYSIIETLGEAPSNTARLLVLIDGQVGVDDATLQIENSSNP